MNFQTSLNPNIILAIIGTFIAVAKSSNVDKKNICVINGEVGSAICGPTPDIFDVPIPGMKESQKAFETANKAMEGIERMQRYVQKSKEKVDQAVKLQKSFEEIREISRQSERMYENLQKFDMDSLFEKHIEARKSIQPGKIEREAMIAKFKLAEEMRKNFHKRKEFRTSKDQSWPSQQSSQEYAEVPSTTHKPTLKYFPGNSSYYEVPVIPKEPVFEVNAF